MLNALIGALGVAIPLLIVGVYGYGKLVETVKSQPELMRMKMKLEIKNEIERHVDKYIHDERESTAARMRAVASQEQAP